jgi:hypothetical protein
MGEMVLGRGTDREGMVARLFAAFQVQLKDIEARVREGAESSEVAKTLQGAAKTLETLLTLDRRVAMADGVAAPDVDGLRAKVMEKLKALRSARVGG